MKPTTLAAVVLILAGLVALWRPELPSANSIPAPADEATRAAVLPIRASLARRDDRRLARFYLALADVVRRDRGRVIATTADLRELNRRAGLLAFQKTELVGKYPGLAEAIDGALAELVGLDDVPLDEAKRTRAIAALEAIAWACGGS